MAKRADGLNAGLPARSDCWLFQLGEVESDEDDDDDDEDDEEVDVDEVDELSCLSKFELFA